MEKTGCVFYIGTVRGSQCFSISIAGVEEGVASSGSQLYLEPSLELLFAYSVILGI